MKVKIVEEMCGAAGVEVRLIEPRSEYDAAVVGLLHKDGRWQAAYDVAKVVETMSEINPEWDSPTLAEWLSHNVASVVVLLDVGA